MNACNIRDQLHPDCHEALNILLDLPIERAQDIDDMENADVDIDVVDDVESDREDAQIENNLEEDEI